MCIFSISKININVENILLNLIIYENLHILTFKKKCSFNFYDYFNKEYQ